MGSRHIHKLFVGNLPWTVGNRELRHHFSQYGYVVMANVIFDKTKGLSRRYGFVQFGYRGAAEAALSNPSQQLEGNTLVVRPSHLKN